MFCKGRIGASVHVVIWTARSSGRLDSRHVRGRRCENESREGRGGSADVCRSWIPTDANIGVSSRGIARIYGYQRSEHHPCKRKANGLTKFDTGGISATLTRTLRSHGAIVAIIGCGCGKVKNELGRRTTNNTVSLSCILSNVSTISYLFLQKA